MNIGIDQNGTSSSPESNLIVLLDSELKERLGGSCADAFFEMLVPTGSRVLDVGCGRGAIGIGLVNFGYSVCGIDLSPQLIKKAIENRDHLNPALQTNIDFKRLSFEFNTFEDESFDQIINLSMIKNIRWIDDFFFETFRILKPGGSAIVQLPCGLTLSDRFKDSMSRLDFSFGIRKKPQGLKPEIKKSSFSVSEIRKRAFEFGLELSRSVYSGNDISCNRDVLFKMEKKI